MYLIKNIKKNILSQFVNNVLYCNCAYNQFLKNDYYKISLRGYKCSTYKGSSYIIENNASNMEKSDFQIRPTKDANKKIILIKCLDNKFSNCVRTKEYDALYLHDDYSLCQIPNNVHQMKYQIVKYTTCEVVQCKLLGYIDYKENMDDFKFIKIVDSNEFSQQTQPNDKIEIELKDEIFDFDQEKETAQIKPDFIQVQNGKLHVVDNQCIVYKPDGKDIAICIGRFNLVNTEGDMFLTAKHKDIQLNFTETPKLPKNLKIIQAWDKVVNKYKFLIKTPTKPAESNGVYVEMGKLDFWSISLHILNCCNIGKIDVSNIQKSDFFLVRLWNRVLIKPANNPNHDLVAIGKNHEALYLLYYDGNPFIELSNFKSTSNDTVQCKLLGYIDCQRDEDQYQIYDFDFIKVVDYKEFSQQRHLSHDIQIELKADMFFYAPGIHVIEVQPKHHNLEHGKLHVVYSKYLLYKPNQYNLSVLLGTLSFFDPKVNLLQFKPEPDLPANFKIVDTLKKGKSPKKNQSTSGNTSGQSHDDHNGNKQSSAVVKGNQNINDHSKTNNANGKSDSYDNTLMASVFLLGSVLIIVGIMKYISNQKEKQQQSEQQVPINNYEMSEQQG